MAQRVNDEIQDLKWGMDVIENLGYNTSEIGLPKAYELVNTVIETIRGVVEASGLERGELKKVE